MKSDKLRQIIQEELEVALIEFTTPSNEMEDLKKLYYDQKKIYSHNNVVGLIRDDSLAAEIKRILAAIQKAYGGRAKKFTSAPAAVGFVSFIPEKPTGEKYAGTVIMVALVKDPTLVSVYGAKSEFYYVIEFGKAEVDAEEATKKYGSTMTQKDV
jgi:uncharacterized protein YeeX (DUF496 family)